MAYAEQKMSGNRITALVIVALIHVVIGYALISGLAYEGVKAVMKKVTTVDVKEEKPKEPPPPPPKHDTPPPPIVAPPPPVNVNITPPPIQTVVTPPPPAPPAPVLAPPAPPAPPPPAPKGPAIPASPRGDPGSWASSEDYPSAALREGAQGTAGFHLTIGPDGRVTSCEITSSSGNDQLDKATCQLVSRRARFTPAKDSDGHPMAGSYSNRIRWQVPKD